MDRTEELICQSQEGDKAAREELIKENMGLIRHVVKRFLGRGVEAEDLFQIGAIGLVKAVDRFDLSFGVRFSTYAVPMIAGEIKRFLRDDSMLKVSRSLKELAGKAARLREQILMERGEEPGVEELAGLLLDCPLREADLRRQLEGVDVSITGNSTNPTLFQHPVAGTYKKECVEQGKKYFSVASGGGTGRTLHPDNMAAGPASYGLTDSMGRMHGDAQFAGSSSVPAHVEMMGLMGMGNNPMVGATVACAVAVYEGLNK